MFNASCFRWVILFGTICLAYGVSAQPALTFERLFVAEGLPAPTVRSFAIDTFGYVWIGTRGGLARYDGQDMEVYEFHPDDSTGLSSGGIVDIATIADQYVAFCTHNKGLYLIDRRDGSLKHYPLDTAYVDKFHVPCLFYGGGDNLYLGSMGGGLVRFDLKTKSLHYYDFTEAVSEEITVHSVATIIGDGNDGLYLGFTAGGVGHFTPSEGAFRILTGDKPVLSPKDLYSVGSMALDSREKLWIGYMGRGLSCLHLPTGKTVDFMQQKGASKFSNIVGKNGITPLSNGDLWLKSRSELHYFRAKDTTFFDYLSEEDTLINSNLPGQSIRALEYDKRGKIYVGGTEGMFVARTNQFSAPPRNGGAYSIPIYLDSIDQLFITEEYQFWAIHHNGQVYKAKSGDSTWSISPVIANRLSRQRRATYAHLTASGELWSPSFRRGLIKYTPPGEDTHFYPNPTAIFNEINDIETGPAGNVFQATMGGLSIFNTSNAAYTHQRILISDDPLFSSNLDLNALCFDSASSLWLASFAGLIKYDYQQERILERYVHDYANPNSISYSQVFSLDLDGQGRLWVGTDYGLNLYLGDGNFQRFLPENGVPHKKITRLYATQAGGAWGETLLGSFYVPPTTDRVIPIPASFGCPRSQQHILGVLPDGQAIIEDCGKWQLVNPASLLGEIEAPANLQITGLRYYAKKQNKTIRIKEWRRDQPLRLEANDNGLEVSFAAIGAETESPNTFKYRIRGLQDQWTPIGTSQKISLPGLPPGDHQLEIAVQLREETDDTTILRLPIQKANYWYRQWWFYLLCVAVFSSLSFLVYRRQHQSALRKRKLVFQQFQSDLYGNLAHELRTPLTLIKAYATRAEKTASTTRADIHRQVDGMVGLIDRLLTVERLQEARLDIAEEEGDLLFFIDNAVSAFKERAEEGGLKLVIDRPREGFITRYAAFAWRSIVNNLLENAIKYSPDGGIIAVSIMVENGELSFSVADPGKGIPQRNKRSVFKRFIRLANDGDTGGSGIGLNYVKALVKQLDGDIVMRDNSPRGTVVIVRCPVQKTTAGKPATTMANSPVDEHSDLPIILVIEDHREMADYLQECLSGHYTVCLAHNGTEGINRALEIVPDAVITDLMLPGMDGIEITQRLKQDRRTSHVPVILLTARSLRESRIAGLKAGADAYLTKPFDPEELKVRLANQLTLRLRLSEHFFSAARTQVQGNKKKAPDQLTSQLPPKEIKQAAPPPTLPGQLKLITRLPQREVDFLEEVKGYILAQLDTVELNADVLAPKLTMSRTQFYRKLQAVSGLSVNLYIRKVRLEVAADHLRQGTESVKEIAYITGFSSPKYLSRLFKKTYGISPSEYRREG